MFSKPKEKLTHKDRVLRHLQRYGKITTWDAIKDYGNTRLSQYIMLLRRENYVIINKRINFKNRFKENGHYDEYILVK